MHSLHEAEARALARSHLAQTEPVMAALVARYGDVWPRRPQNMLHGLVGLVVDQQISVHAAAAIRHRLRARLGDRWTADALGALGDADLIQCGLSAAKRRTLRAIVAASLDGELDGRRLAGLDDDTLVAQLTRIHGIGPWTAQMFQLFALGRPDVLAPGDLGLQNAARDRYELGGRPDPDRFARLAEPWRPYRSLASVYLWASLERGNWKTRREAS